MISLTRLNGERIALNADLIERAEETPDTVLTLVNGTKYVVAETLDELIGRIQMHRATILALSSHVPTVDPAPGSAPLRLVTPPAPASAAADGTDDVPRPSGDQGGQAR